MRGIVVEQLKQVKTGNKIGVGVQNNRYPDRLYFHYGTVVDIDDTYITLEVDNKLNAIQLDVIIIIRMDAF